MEEIINKVANSALEVFDLEDYYPKGMRVQIDISQWLLEGFLLKEKDFREHLKNHDWSQYQDQYVAINCSTDAIVPAWSSILVAIQLAPYAKKVVNGTIEDLDASLYEEILSKLDYSDIQKQTCYCKRLFEKTGSNACLYFSRNLSATFCKKYYVRRSLFSSTFIQRI